MTCPAQDYLETLLLYWTPLAKRRCRLWFMDCRPAGMFLSLSCPSEPTSFFRAENIATRFWAPTKSPDKARLTINAPPLGRPNQPLVDTVSGDTEKAALLTGYRAAIKDPWFWSAVLKRTASGVGQCLR